MASWYLKKTDGTIYGPKDETALREWAMNGRIAPEDQISTDQNNWQSVTLLPALEMEWSLIYDDGERYGPLHLFAMIEWLLDGTLPYDSQIIHVQTGERTAAGGRILMALLDLVRQQRQQNEDTLAQLTASQTAYTQLNELQESTLATTDAPPSFKELQKWQRLYEDERRHRQESEERLGEQSRILRQQLHETQSDRDRLLQQVRQLDDVQKDLRAALESENPEGQAVNMALMESYQQLSRNYDAILNQLTVKSEEASALMAAREETEQSADHRVREIEERLTREREEADSARKRLAEMETAHVQLVRAFRDMNDRFIRMRQSVQSTHPQHGDGTHQIDDPADDDTPHRIQNIKRV